MTSVLWLEQAKSEVFRFFVYQRGKNVWNCGLSVTKACHWVKSRRPALQKLVLLFNTNVTIQNRFCTGCPKSALKKKKKDSLLCNRTQHSGVVKERWNEAADGWSGNRIQTTAEVLREDSEEQTMSLAMGSWSIKPESTQNVVAWKTIDRLRRNPHRTRDVTHNATQANRTCWCEWECSHCTQATSKEKCSNLRARCVPRPVWIGPKAPCTPDATQEAKQIRMGKSYCSNRIVHTAGNKQCRCNKQQNGTWLHFFTVRQASHPVCMGPKENTQPRQIFMAKKETITQLWRMQSRQNWPVCTPGCSVMLCGREIQLSLLNSNPFLRLIPSNCAACLQLCRSLGVVGIEDQFAVSFELCRVSK